MATTETERTCVGCERTLPIDCYYVHSSGPGGRAAKCRDCRREYQTKYREVQIARAKAVAEGMRVCRSCGETKPLGEYHANSKSAGGRSARCAVCENAIHAAYKARKRAAIVDAKQGGWVTTVDDAMHQAAAAFARWTGCEDYEERAGAREAAIYRARQLLAAVGG